MPLDVRALLAASVLAFATALHSEDILVTDWADKALVTVGSVTLELPAVLVDARGAAIDSAAGVFEGSGLTVIVDQGPFADRLDALAGRPDYRETSARIAGKAARIVFHRGEEPGSYTVATHLPAPQSATVVVRAEASVPEPVSRAIVESLQLRD